MKTNSKHRKHKSKGGVIQIFGSTASIATITGTEEEKRFKSW